MLIKFKGVLNLDYVLLTEERASLCVIKFNPHTTEQNNLHLTPNGITRDPTVKIGQYGNMGWFYYLFLHIGTAEDHGSKLWLSRGVKFRKVT